MQTATREDIFACFRLLLGREMHEEEYAIHMPAVGLPLDELVRTFVTSEEFRARGILPTDGAELVDLGDFKIYVNPEDPLIAPAIRANAYEPEVTEVFKKFVKPGHAVIDIGANCGYYSMLAASLGAYAIAIEPLQRNLRLLYASIAENGYVGRVKPIAGAATSHRIETFGVAAQYTNGVISPINNGHGAMEYALGLAVDDILEASYHPPFLGVSLLKLDTEGHEYPALAGASHTIVQYRPVIITEFGPAALEANSRIAPELFLGQLRLWNYTLSVIGQPELTRDEQILAACEGRDHVDLLCLPR